MAQRGRHDAKGWHRGTQGYVQDTAFIPPWIMYSMYMVEGYLNCTDTRNSAAPQVKLPSERRMSSAPCQHALTISNSPPHPTAPQLAVHPLPPPHADSYTSLLSLPAEESSAYAMAVFERHGFGGMATIDCTQWWKPRLLLEMT